MGEDQKHIWAESWKILFVMMQKSIKKYQIKLKFNVQKLNLTMFVNAITFIYFGWFEY